MVMCEQIEEVLANVRDPELPLSITDLGIVHAVRVSPDGGRVEIDITPTFVGCPALDMIRGDIVERVRALAGVGDVAVNFVYEPPWTTDRISEAGRESLRQHGVTVPPRGQAGRLRPQELYAASGSFVPLTASDERVLCPFCGSERTRVDSPFGPMRCMSIWYCEACRNSFQHVKRLA